MEHGMEDKTYQCPHCGEDIKESALVGNERSAPDQEWGTDTKDKEDKTSKDRLMIAISMLKAPKGEIEKEKAEMKSGEHKEPQGFKKV